MTHEIIAGSVLIEENTVLPKELQFETEAYVPGWRVVKDLDGLGLLGREISRIGWTFFCLAGEVRSTVFGIDRQKMARRAIERILARAKSQKLNSLEILQVTSVGSGRFPLVHHLTVSARLRHIQAAELVSERPGFLMGMPAGKHFPISSWNVPQGQELRGSAVRSHITELPGEGMHESHDYKGFAVIATARQINCAPNEVWRPLYRINGTDQSQAWTPRDRSVVFATEKTAIAEAVKRAQWLIDNSPPGQRT